MLAVLKFGYIDLYIFLYRLPEDGAMLDPRSPYQTVDEVTKAEEELKDAAFFNNTVELIFCLFYFVML